MMFFPNTSLCVTSSGRTQMPGSFVITIPPAQLEYSEAKPRGLMSHVGHSRGMSGGMALLALCGPFGPEYRGASRSFGVIPEVVKWCIEVRSHPVRNRFGAARLAGPLLRRRARQGSHRFAIL